MGEGIPDAEIDFLAWGYRYGLFGIRENIQPQSVDAGIINAEEKVEEVAKIKFNSVLLNYYRDGNDSVAWRSDRESVLGKNPVIALVSFGQVRSFDIRNKADHSQHYSVKLEHGSFY